MKEIKIVTHSASFHADDCMAVATILLSLPSDVKTRVVRSRHPDEIASGDFVVDVGGTYDPGTNRFDHHQKGGAGKRDNGIPYAAFGLVWKNVGQKLCTDANGETDMVLWQKIDNELVAAVDASDNGFDISRNLVENVFAPSLTLSFMIEKPTWEERGNEATMNEAFMKAVTKAKDFLERYIVVQRAAVTAEREIIATYKATENKELVVFVKDYERLSFIHTLAKLPDIKFFVYPDNSGTWSAETVPAREGSFEKRKDFPAEWAGLTDANLENISGIKGAYFCHNGRFLCKARTEEGAILLAKKALEL